MDSYINRDKTKKHVLARTYQRRLVQLILDKHYINEVVLHIDTPGFSSRWSRVSSLLSQLCCDMTTLGQKGHGYTFVTNHFQVNCPDNTYIYQYNAVNFSDEDGSPVVKKDIVRKLVDKVHEKLSSGLGRQVIYDGETTLFTSENLEETLLKFSVRLDEAALNRNGRNASPDGTGSERANISDGSKIFNVELLLSELPVQKSGRVFDTILRQDAAKKGYEVVGQSFFSNDPSNFYDLGGGVSGCRGFYSSFQGIQDDLFLNLDVSSKFTVKPGPLLNFLIENQKVTHDSQIDWSMVSHIIKGLRIKVLQSPEPNIEYKIAGLTRDTCENMFIKVENDGSTMLQSVYEHFVNYRNIELEYSRFYPCITVETVGPLPFLPIEVIPIELCDLVLQSNPNLLTNSQKDLLVKHSRDPQEIIDVLDHGFKHSNFKENPRLCSFGISISSHLTEVEGRVLVAPKLKVGKGECLISREGRFDFNGKTLYQPVEIQRWGIANFCHQCAFTDIASTIIDTAKAKGITMSKPAIFEGLPESRTRTASAKQSVENMFRTIDQTLQLIEDIHKSTVRPLEFILCVLPQKDSLIYGPWMKECMIKRGIRTQCITAGTVFDHQCLSSCMLKINAKLGGMNFLLSSPIRSVSKVPTLIIGMGVSHGSPGCSDVPSVAAVVSSRNWPQVSRYRAFVSSQPQKHEMIDSLFKLKGENAENAEGMFSELLVDFYVNFGGRDPQQIIIFRDGVSESQFIDVLNIELKQIIEACKHYDMNPKFLVIVAQTNHNTLFLEALKTKGSQPYCNAENVPPGTVIDKKICNNGKDYEFYFCANKVASGTTRPTHYHVLRDEIGLSPTDVQELVHSLSYVSQNSTTAVPVVAPIQYARSAAAQMLQILKLEDTPKKLPELHENVISSMYFC